MTDRYKQLKKIQNNRIYLTLCHIQIAYIALYESNIYGYQQKHFTQRKAVFNGVISGRKHKIKYQCLKCPSTSS